jgi:hypothetical protein
LEDISHVGNFDETDMFMGFHEDTLSSVVLLHTLSSTEDVAKILQICKEDLVPTLEILSFISLTELDMDSIF